uniref:Uncharacterized protein n=1 Tax=Rhizophora mucronata TaxID=61149 RepID=A0A2P2PYH7_RHIMU
MEKGRVILCYVAYILMGLLMNQKKLTSDGIPQFSYFVVGSAWHNMKIVLCK